MLVPTIKLLEFSDKNWETYERLLIFWSIFWLFFLLSKVSKMKFHQKSLIHKNTTLYDIDFPQKIGIFRFFLRKFLLTVLHIIYGKYYEFLLSKVSKMKFHQKSLIHKNTSLYDIDFPQKIGIFRFFLRKFLLTVLHIFHRKYTPNFQKIDFSIYPNILYICDQNFMLVPTIKLLEFSDKNWETYERLLIFWSIFWLFFLLSKVSKMKFHQKSLIHKNTTLYDIDFPQKIGIFRFFLRKFLLTVLHIIYGKYYEFLLSKVSKMKFHQKSLIHKNTSLYDIDFPQKIGIFRFFLRKFLLTVLHIFHRKYTPNFQKIDFSIYPNILYICDQNFMLVPTIKLLEFSDKNWETYERLLIFWSIFWLFFLLSKVSKMKFHQKSLIHKNTSLYDIDFPQKIGIFRFFLRKFLLTVLHIFHRKYTPNFQKIDFSIYPNILYICDQNFMLVPTIKLLEFSDKNWETYERLLIFWSIFWLFFLLSKVSKMKFHQKSLIHKNTTLYDIDFPQKIGIFRFFLRKFLLTVLHIIYGKYYEFLLSKVSKMKFHQKSLIHKNTSLYDIDFPQKIGIFRFFLRKFLLTVLHIFHRKYTPNFQKIDFSIYPNILYICDQNFMLVPTIKLLEFSDKNWETYERLLIFWSIFWLFFLLSKVSKMKFHQKSLIHKNTTLYDIDFPQKIGIFRFFLRKFLLTVLHIIYGKYYEFLLSKVSKMKFHQKSLIHKNTSLYDIDFPQKIGIFRFFLRKFLLTVLHIFHRKYTPNFQKIDFSIYPNILYICDQNFMLVPTIKLLEFSDKNWETYERLLIFWSIFWLFFLLSKVSKMKFHQKSLIHKNTTLYDIDFPQKIGIFRFFLRKFLLTVLHIIYGKYYEFLLSKVSKMKFHQKSLIHKNTSLYDIDFPQKIGIFRFFLRKFLLTVLHIFHRKYTPNFQKIDFSIYPNILYICDQNFMLVPTIKLLEFSDKNWETYERLLIFWSIFWLFFLLSKVSKMKFHQKSLIHKNTTLYDIDFPQKIGIFRFFLRKFLLTVLHIIYGKYYEFLLSKVSKMKFHQKSLIHKNTSLYDIDFPQKIGIFRFFLRKFLLTVLHIFHRKYTPNFQKIDFSIYPNILYICDQNFMLVPTIKLLEFSDKNWETYERLLIFWSIFWLFFLLSKVSKMKFHQKSLIHKNTSLYDIDFPQKIGIFRFFLRKFLLTVLHIFHRKYTPNFQKIDFSIYPNILYICDQNFMLVPTIKLLEFSDKNWETYERLLIFWSIFWLFFLLSKVSKMKFHQKSLIHKNTTLYDIDFPQKIGIFRFFLRKFLLTVLHIIYGKYYEFLLSKVSKMKFHQKSLIHKNTSLYDIDFPQKIGIFRFFLRKFLLTVLHIFHRKYTPNFQKIDFSIYPNILYICDQNFMLVPTIKLLEFSDKNWETYERLLIFWSIFWLFFLLSKVSKMKFHQKSLIHKNTTLYDIDFPQKIGIFRFFLRKFLLTVLHIIYGKYYEFLLSKVSKMKFHQKSLIHKNTSLYDIDFPQKIGIFRFFLRKFLLTVLHIFHRKYTPNFQKIDFSIYPNILYICDQNFMLVPTIKLLEFSDKNWETYERLLIFWSIFWLFFLLSKVSKMKFHQKSLIHKNTTLYDIDFPQKIGIFRFFLRKFLLTVLHIIYGKYYEFLLSKVSKMKFHQKSLIHKNTSLYDIDFPQKIGIFRFFLRKFLLTVLHIFHRKYTPNFQKIDFSIYPNILYICDQNFMLVPTIKLLEFSDKNWETYERLLIFWSIFWLFFLLSKVSKMKFHQKSLIHKNTTLYDIDFPQKIGIFRFFLRKFLLTVLHIISWKIHPKFSKNRLFHIPQYIIYLSSENPWYTKIHHCTTLEFSS